MEKLLTIDEVSELLQIPKGSLYNLVHEGRIPHLKIGRGRLRFRERALEKWLQQNEQQEKNAVMEQIS